MKIKGLLINGGPSTDVFKKALGVLCLCGIYSDETTLVKINTLLMWFFCILLSGSIRAKDGKEGDRMGHRDDVLGDDRLIYEPIGC